MLTTLLISGRGLDDVQARLLRREGAAHGRLAGLQASTTVNCAFHGLAEGDEAAEIFVLLFHALPFAALDDDVDGGAADALANLCAHSVGSDDFDGGFFAYRAEAAEHAHASVVRGGMHGHRGAVGDGLP